MPLSTTSKLSTTNLDGATIVVVPSFLTEDEITWTPEAGDLVLLGNSLRIWNGTKWQTI
jgi:hypothetical protein